jgi:hypothetical protein
MRWGGRECYGRLVIEADALPLSEAAVEQFLKVISAWRRARDFEEPSALQRFLANKLIA